MFLCVNTTNVIDAPDKLAARQVIIFFLIVFVFTCLEGALVRVVILPYILPKLHAGEGFIVGGDSIGFHAIAVDLADKIRANGWATWELRPTIAEANLATPAGVASAIYALFGTNPLLLLVFNALVHGLSAVCLLFIVRTLFDQRPYLITIVATLPFILLPTAIIWTSQLLKDGIFILGIYTYLLSWLLLANLNTKKYIRNILFFLALSAFGNLVILSVRSYMAEVLMAMSIVLGVTMSMAICFTAKEKKQQRLFRISIILICVSTSVLFLKIIKGNEVNNYLNAAHSNTVKTEPTVTAKREADDHLSNSALSAQSQLMPTAAANAPFDDPDRPNTQCQSQWQMTPGLPSALDYLVKALVVTREGYYSVAYKENGSTIDRGKCINSAPDFVAYLPRAFQIGLLAPFPNQWFEENSHGGGASRKIAGIEMLITYLALSALVLLSSPIRKKIEYWAIMLFALTMLLLLGIVHPNLGALHRLRYGFLMIVVGLGSALLVDYFYKNRLARNEHATASLSKL
jgi:hypothetical protein